MKYEMMAPEEPDNDVVDRNGVRWTKCETPGYWRRGNTVWTYGGIISWGRLIVDHGPLTDVPVKPTLESFSKKLDEWTEDVFEMPDLAKRVFDYFSPWME